MENFIHDDKGKSMISNDGATIMKLLDIVPPIVNIAKFQDVEVCNLQFQ
jgi:T-complex protein 1 subunit eta